MLAGDGGRTIRTAMADASIRPSACSADHTSPSFVESIIGDEALYQSARKCYCGVGRKYSVKAYRLNAIRRTIDLSDDLKSGKYREGPTHIVPIEYPKKRTALSISFRDRVFQRSLNDTALYPQMTRSFVYANYACQRGKGTDAARLAFKAMVRRAYLRFGTDDFYILSGDVKGYYDNMAHGETDRIFAKHCDPWTAEIASRTLTHQYSGETGYNPGSQMVQIAGISYLDKMDHFIKEGLRQKLYIRYMDDFHVIARTKDELEAVMDGIAAKLAEVGLKPHPAKTRIVSAKRGTLFLGFVFKITDTGKALMLRDPEKVKENRRKLLRLGGKVVTGERDMEDLERSYRCIMDCIGKGNSDRLVRNMKEFYRKLKEDIYARIDHQRKSAA